MTMSLLIRTTLKQILPLRTIFREKFRSRTLPPHRIQRRKPTLHRIFLLMASATTTSRTETLLISSNQIFRDNLISSKWQWNRCPESKRRSPYYCCCWSMVYSGSSRDHCRCKGMDLYFSQMVVYRNLSTNFPVRIPIIPTMMTLPFKHSF